MGNRKFDQVNGPNKVAKLSAFGFSSGKSNKENVSPVSCKNHNISTASLESSGSSKKKGKFLESWKVSRSWLRYDSSEHLMFCDICIQAQGTNVFTTGFDMMKKEAVTKHEKRTAKSMTMARETALTKSKSAVISALKNVYFAAVNNLPNNIVPKLNDVYIDQGASQLKDLQVDSRTSYSHNQSVQEFQQSLASVLEESLLLKVRNSGSFSLIIDESSDVSTHQNLLVYIRYLGQVLGRVVGQTSFLSIRQLSVADATTIKDVVYRC